MNILPANESSSNAVRVVLVLDLEVRFCHDSGELDCCRCFVELSPTLCLRDI